MQQLKNQIITKYDLENRQQELNKKLKSRLSLVKDFLRDLEKVHYEPYSFPYTLKDHSTEIKEISEELIKIQKQLEDFKEKCHYPDELCESSDECEACESHRQADDDLEYEKMKARG